MSSAAKPDGLPRKSGGFLRQLFLVFLVFLPVAEIIAFGFMWHWWGFFLTFSAAVLLSIIGVVVLRFQVVRSVHVVRLAANKRKMPSKQMQSSTIGVFAGFLLVFPGFISAVIGIVLLMPGINRIARGLVGIYAANKLAGITTQLQEKMPGYDQFMGNSNDQFGTQYAPGDTADGDAANAVITGEILDDDGGEEDSFPSRGAQ